MFGFDKSTTALEKHKKKYNLDGEEKKVIQKDFSAYSWIVLAMLIIVRISH
jgi:hypothetical protein